MSFCAICNRATRVECGGCYDRETARLRAELGRVTKERESFMVARMSVTHSLDAAVAEAKQARTRLAAAEAVVSAARRYQESNDDGHQCPRDGCECDGCALGDAIGAFERGSAGP